MAVAVFDLDNTLIGGDSDVLWGEFLVELGAVDAAHYQERNEWFYQQYLAGVLDINDYLTFALQPLAANDLETLHEWREQFIANYIEPILLPKAVALIEKHRAQRDILLIITATNKFITAPIAKRLGIEELLATEPEIIGGRYTGKYNGTPTFQSGKITAWESWRAANAMTNEPFYFYSDSHNDLPLLEIANYPVAVDPDSPLKAKAQENGWPIISLRDE